jgi:hypothetical protein
MTENKSKPTLEEALAKSFGVPSECIARFSPDVIEYAKFKASQVKKQYKLELKRKTELDEATPLLAKKSNVVKVPASPSKKKEAVEAPAKSSQQNTKARRRKKDSSEWDSE